MSDHIRDAFRQQAGFTRAAGSEFTARLLETLADVLDETTRTGARILAWPTHPIADALKLRVTGGLHALARSGDDAEWSAFYRTGSADADPAELLKRVLAEYDDRLYPWLDSPPQTNEVGRAGALWPGIMEVARRFGPKVELVELGPSAGLNMNMDRFNYDLGSARAGDPASPVNIAPLWRGTPPVLTPVEVVARVGIDQNPLDVSKSDIAEKLIAYVWPDQPERLARIEGAIAIARTFPPPMVKGDAANWLETHLQTPQPAGMTRIVYHSVVLQYLPREDRRRVGIMLEKAGEAATPERPLAWLSLEHHAVGAPAELRLTCWPGGERATLATVHPHGAEVNWNRAAS